LLALILSRVVLPDVKSKEVKSGFALERFEGVCHAGFARFQFQSHALKPSLDNLTALTYYVGIAMEDDEVIRIADQHWPPSFPTAAFQFSVEGEALGDDGFQSV